jgi:2,4-dienoyl-CoA reductase (NADPH2)
MEVSPIGSSSSTGRERRGGVGLAVVGIAKIEGHFMGGLAVHNDRYVPGLKRMVGVFHQYDVKCAL